MLPIFDRIGPFRLSVEDVIDKDVSKHSTIDCDARTATGLRLPVSAIERLLNNCSRIHTSDKIGDSIWRIKK